MIWHFNTDIFASFNHPSGVDLTADIGIFVVAGQMEIWSMLLQYLCVQ